MKKKAIRDYVSIPYGKGKGSRPVRHRTTLPGVSIPYGKGKVESGKSGRGVLVVSIPYGKGKEERRVTTMIKKKVSIPYGKGKEHHFVPCFYYNP